MLITFAGSHCSRSSDVVVNAHCCRMTRHGPVFQSHLLGKPTVVVGDLANWQRVLSADFQHVDQRFPESFVKAAGANPHLDKAKHSFRVDYPTDRDANPRRLESSS